MLAEGDRVLVAFSGGADSTALAIVLKTLGYDVVLGHVDHGIRSNSGDDLVHCARVATLLGVRLVSRKATVLPPTEAAAREARYAALVEMAEEVGAAKIATGHTLDDDAETVAMRLERGGFGYPIPPVRGRFVRPLIAIRRADTEAICRQSAVAFLIDPTNADLSITRNRVRAQLRADGEDKIASLVRIGRENAAMVARGRAAADQILAASERHRTMTLIPTDALRSCPAGVAAQAVRMAAERFSTQVTRAAVARALASVGKTGGATQLGPLVWAWGEPGHLVVGRAPDAPAPAALQIGLGRNPAPQWGMVLTVTPSATSPIPVDPYTALLDRERLEIPLMLRSWAPGDRFHPLGGPGSKKLHDFFIDSKVPRRLRPTIGVLTSAGQIAWVLGMRIDDRFKVTSTTSDALLVAVTPLTPQDNEG